MEEGKRVRRQGPPGPVGPVGPVGPIGGTVDPNQELLEKGR